MVLLSVMSRLSSSDLPKRLKLLCLHSFRTSGKIFQEQFKRSGLDTALSDIAELVYVDAPIAATGPPLDDVEPYFDPPFYEWWTSTKGADQKWTYTGWDRSFAAVEEHLQRHGPYDGLLGFSQGAGLAAVLTGLQSRGHLLQDVPAFKCVVLVAGFKSREPLHAPAFEVPIAVPSVHLIGELDAMRAAGLQLLPQFQNPVHIAHRRGHVIPRLSRDEIQELRAFLERVQTGVPAGPISKL